MPPALDWLDMTQPPPPRAHRPAPDSRHSECTALSPSELAIVGICLFGLIYMIEILVEVASR